MVVLAINSINSESNFKQHIWDVMGISLIHSFNFLDFALMSMGIACLNAYPSDSPYVSLFLSLSSLTTLHAALNDYSYCCARDAQPKSSARFPKMQNLYLSENRLGTWSDICCIGGHFPHLQHLVLLRNPLKIVPPMLEEERKTPFASLEDLNLMETSIDTWESVDALTHWFPALKSLRLGKDIPLLKVSKGFFFVHPARLFSLIFFGLTCPFFHHFGPTIKSSQFVFYSSMKTTSTLSAIQLPISVNI
ncbi:unnamed protein product [Hydatigera taeniaeformis]|uniref:Uncharacterized protein n=1 Tax=Hydatigena taeniaeformis TaxID=6205 RepID=A0A3P7FBL4_HYDTA|nr:unnamed protein product [Hydatigera taeniaeformis]